MLNSFVMIFPQILLQENEGKTRMTRLLMLSRNAGFGIVDSPSFEMIVVLQIPD